LLVLDHTHASALRELGGCSRTALTLTHCMWLTVPQPGFAEQEQL
jgi:hypothetical protein